MTTSPIFIVGPPRSGTHLIRFCLSQHSKLFFAPETAFFIRIYGNRRLEKNTFAEGLGGKLAKEIIEMSGDPTMKDHCEQFNSICVKSEKVTDYRDLADVFFTTLAGSTGKVRWGEKTPLHALYLKQIFNVYPNAKIIFVMRGAKNTIASTLSSGHTDFGFYNALATYLRIRKEQVIWTNSPNVYNVSYEEFVANPRKLLYRICNFLDEEFEESMLKPGMIDSSYTSDVMWRRQNIGILPDDPHKWKNVLTVEQSITIERALTGSKFPFTFKGLVLLRAKILVYIRTIKNRSGFFHLFGNKTNKEKNAQFNQ